MFDALKRFFAGDTSSPATDSSLSPETAAAALMVEVALADGVYARIEETQIARALEQAFELSEPDALALLEKAETLAEAAVDHHRFTTIVKTGLSKEKRLSLMEHMWRIVLADGERDDAEDSLLRRLGPLLAITDRERAEARQRVISGLH